MAQIKTHKYVAALPPVLEADAIYFVRAGDGFDLYVTNHSGTIVAYPINGSGLTDYGTITGGFDVASTDDGLGTSINFKDQDGNLVGSLKSYLDMYPGDEFGEIVVQTRNPKTGATKRAIAIDAESGKTTLSTRPTWKDALAQEITPWDSENLDISTFAPKNNPDFLGNPTAPTRLSTDNSKSLATTEFVQSTIMKGLSAYCSGKPTASEKIGGGTAPYTFTISTANSKAVADVAATASTVFNILKGGSNIGTITFSAGGTVGVFNMSSPNITKGDKLRIIAPATPDVTLADIDFLLVS